MGWGVYDTIGVPKPKPLPLNEAQDTYTTHGPNGVNSNAFHFQMKLYQVIANSGVR